MTDTTTQPLPEGYCNTAGCFAGWFAMSDGFVFKGEMEQFHSPVLVNTEGHRLTTRYEDYDRDDNIAGYVASRLELFEGEATHLFNGGNSLAELKEIVAELCAQPKRSRNSKRLLRKTLAVVEQKAAQGLWEQGDWITVLNEAQVEGIQRRIRANAQLTARIEAE